MNITGQKSDSETITGGVVRDLLVTFRVVNTTGTGTMFTLPTFTNVTLKVTLVRSGTKYEIMNDNLFNLSILSHYLKGLEPWTLGANMLQKGNGYAICSMKIKLGGPINLANGDSLITEVNVAPGTYTTAGFNVPGCSADFTWQPSDAVEVQIPGIKVYTMQTNSTQQNVSCGDNVSRILVQNLDKGFTTSSSPTDANQVITQMTVSSAQKVWNDLPDRLNARIPSLFESLTEAIYRGQGYLYVADGQKLNNVRLTINLTAANVNAGQNIVVWEYFITTAQTTVNAIQQSSQQSATAVNNLAAAVGTQGMQAIIQNTANATGNVQAQANNAVPAGARNIAAAPGIVAQHAVAASKA